MQEDRQIPHVGFSVLRTPGSYGSRTLTCLCNQPQGQTVGAKSAISKVRFRPNNARQSQPGVKSDDDDDEQEGQDVNHIRN